MATSKNPASLLDSNSRLNNLSVSLLEIDLSKEASMEEFYLRFLLSKGRKTHAAISALCREGFGQDAAVLCRALFEMMVVGTYIFNKETEKRLGMFLNHGWLAKKERFKYFLSREELKTLFEERQEEHREGNLTRNEVELYAKEAEKEFSYNGRYVWSEKTIKGMAEEVGREQAYETVYKIMCDLAHTNSASMNEYITMTNNWPTFHWESDQNWVNQSLVASFDFLLAIVTLYNSYLKMGVDKHLKKLTEEYLNSVNALDKATHKN